LKEIAKFFELEEEFEDLKQTQMRGGCKEEDFA